MQELFGGMDLGWDQYLFIAVAGVVTGIINTLAGSGSLITLPIFVFLCGLPADVANGTNRIGAFLQSGVGYYSFAQSGIQQQMKGAAWLVIPAILGAIPGSLIAAQMNERMMNLAIGILMLIMLGVLMVNPKRWLRESAANTDRNKNPWILVLFFFIGLYGGFIQAGIGIFLMASLVLAAHYSLSASAGVKLLVVLLLNIPTLIIFSYYHQVHLGFGLIMAVSQSIGAVLAVRFATRVPNANVWIHRLLVVIVIISATKFIYEWATAA